MPSYIKIPTEILQDKRLNPTQILLYGMIMSLSKKEWYCRASNKTLGESMWLTVNAIQKNLIALKDAWYIEVEDNTHIKNYMGGRKFYMGGVENFIPNNNIYNISSKEDICPKTSSDEKTATSDDVFEDVWKAYPNYNSRGSKKKAREFFKDKNPQELLYSARVWKRKVELWLEDIQFVKWCHLRIRDYEPPNDMTQRLDMKKIFEKHMLIWWADMRERMERLKQDFPDVDFKQLREELSEKNSLLHKMTFT